MLIIMCCYKSFSLLLTIIKSWRWKRPGNKAWKISRVLCTTSIDFLQITHNTIHFTNPALVIVQVCTDSLKVFMYTHLIFKVPQRVHYMKHCTRVWARGKYSTRLRLVLYLASTPHPSAIFHVVHKRMRYFNWFIVFSNFCAVLELMCRVLFVSSAFWKLNSGRILLVTNHLP